MRPHVVIFGLAALLVPGMTLAQEARAVGVAEASIAVDVSDRQPVDTGTEFPADVDSLVCWTRIVGAEPETTVEHVWYHGDREVDRVELRIGGPSWRTWSRKRIPASWTGTWRVDVVGPDAEVLETLDFTVR